MKLSNLLLIGVVTLTTQLSANPVETGIVDYMRCVETSKIGKNEQGTLEALSKQMMSNLEGKQKTLQEMAKKLDDPDHLDSLSPEAANKLTSDFQNLQAEYGQIQQQYGMTVNQAKMQIIQKIGQYIAAGSDKIAKEKNLKLVLNKDVCPYFDPSLDITEVVIKKMDAAYDEDILKAMEASKKSAE